MTFPGTTTDIPEDLLKYQEQGRVVFFCGAGISYDAGIPLFRGLLEKTAKGINHSLTEEEKKLRRDGQFDQLYFRLEQANGDRIRVRRESLKYLVPPTPVKETAISKHISLLKLSKGRDGMSRIVTTNYDPLFDMARNKIGVVIPSYAAPLLPVPKDYKWDGVVYVHGKLEDDPTDANLETLVLSSGDFGQAYLTERWASRFVAELFRDYVVCFVGYSVNDVILKYMVDAITAERNHRHRTPAKKPLPIYAFSGVKNGQWERDSKEWDLRGIISIPYEVSGRSHRELTAVLAAWARYHEIGRMEKGAIVKEALKSPPDSVSEIGRRTIERVVWSLKEPVGCAELPYGDQISDITAKWIEHLPAELILGDTGHAVVAWVGSHHGFPESLQWCIRNERFLDDECVKSLLHIVPARKDNKLDELWRLFLAGHQRRVLGDYSQWMEKRKEIGELTAGLRREFKDLVQPELLISVEDRSWYSVSNTLRRFFDWSVMIDHSLGYVDIEDVELYLPELMPEMTVALVEACELLKEFDGYDFSYFHIASLFDEDESRTSSCEWYQLLILMKHGLIGLGRQSQGNPRQIVKWWMQYDYPAFYRLVLWGVSRLPEYSIDNVVDWITSHEGALWEESCAPELLGLMKEAFQGLSEVASAKLQTMILSPSEGFKPTGREKATRLEHLKSSGVSLLTEAEAYIKSIAESDSVWASRDRSLDGVRVIEDGAFDVSPQADGDESRFEVPVSLGEAKNFLEDWLKKDMGNFSRLFSAWVIKENHLQCVFDLGVKLNWWPKAIWDLALEATRYDRQIELAINALTDAVVAAMPMELMDAVQVKLGFWLQSAAKNHLKNDATFALCKRFLLEVSAHEATGGTRNAEAPFELVMETLLRNWFDGEPRVRSLISEPYREMFSLISKGATLGLRYARCALLQQIGSLYAVDSAWTVANLVPLLSWGAQNDTAKESWENAVLSNRYESGLLELVWPDFEVSIGRYSEFGEIAAKGLVDLLVCHALRAAKLKTKKLCTKALENLTEKGREQAAINIYERLTFKGNNHDAIWRNEVYPFLKNVWPGDKKYRDAAVFCHIADGILTLDECFGQAVDCLKGFAISEKCHMTFGPVLESGIKGAESHCKRHPSAALKLLSYLGDFSGFPMSSLRNCLEMIRQATNNEPGIVGSDTFKRLSVMVAEKANDW